MRLQNILQTIGNTPCIRLNKIFSTSNDVNVWLKLETKNPASCLKTRIAFNMIKEAEKEGILKKGQTIVEPTSGNTGIGLAMVSAVLGYNLTITMPESMSEERKQIFKAFGTNLVLTDPEEGMKGAIKKAKEILKTDPNTWMPSQFENPNNPKTYKSSMANEIITDFKDGLDYLFSAIGTGGHISGLSEVLKKKWPNLKVIGIEPENSPILSKKNPKIKTHKIQGIGAGFIPKTLNTNVLDEVITISNKEAYSFTSLIAKKEGILVGISTGSVLAAIKKKESEFKERSNVLTFAYDSGERYLSTKNLW